jgi:hypothetical protein
MVRRPLPTGLEPLEHLEAALEPPAMATATARFSSTTGEG